MTESQWLVSTDAIELFDFVHDQATERKLRLFGCACLQFIWSQIGEELPMTLGVVAAFADGTTTKAALKRARAAVRQERHDLEASDAGMRPMWGACWLAEVAASENAYASVLAELKRLSSDILFLEADDWTAICGLLRDIFGNPFHTHTCDSTWLTSTVTLLATAIYAEKAFERLPILADALEDAGCDSTEILTHLRGDGTHVAGCWALDLVLGKS